MRPQPPRFPMHIPHTILPLLLCSIQCTRHHHCKHLTCEQRHSHPNTECVVVLNPCLDLSVEMCCMCVEMCCMCVEMCVCVSHTVHMRHIHPTSTHSTLHVHNPHLFILPRGVWGPLAPLVIKYYHKQHAHLTWRVCGVYTGCVYERVWGVYRGVCTRVCT